MNKKQVILIISILVFIGVLIGISILLNNIHNNNINTNQPKGEVLRVDTDTWDEKVLSESKYVLVDFYADWCGPCQMLSPLVEELAGDNKYNKDFKYYKVNVDYDSELATNYYVQYLPTLVIFKNGEEISRSVGYMNKEQLIEFINSVK